MAALSPISLYCLILILLAVSVNIIPQGGSVCHKWSNWTSIESCQWISRCQCFMALTRVCQVGEYIYSDNDNCFLKSELTKQLDRPCRESDCPAKSAWGEWNGWSIWNTDVCPQKRIRKRDCVGRVSSGSVREARMGGCAKSLDAFQRQNSTVKQCQDYRSRMGSPTHNSWFNLSNNYFVYGGIGTGISLIVIGIPVLIYRCFCLPRRRRRHFRRAPTQMQSELSTNAAEHTFAMLDQHTGSPNWPIETTSVAGTVPWQHHEPVDNESDLPPSYDSFTRNPESFGD